MSIISHRGKDYDVPAYSVQDDSSATSLDSSKVPTGGTVQAVYGDPDTYMIKGTDYVTAGKKANTTLGVNATAEGLDTTASSDQAHAEGKNTVASGSSSHAEGEGCTANGLYAHAEGWHTTAGSGCHAEGSGSTASVSYSHAEGVSTTASEEGAHAEGYVSQATKKGSHSENRAYAQGEFSHAEGLFSKTKAAQAHAEGTGTLASSESQHVQGKYNVEDANGIYAHIVGNGTNSNSRSNIHTIDWSGNAWFAGDVTDGSGNVLSDKADSNDISGSKSASSNPIIIEDSANAYAEEVIASISPIQDLHGYDKPWVGGAGKNIQPLTVDGIKSVNTSATWTGNSITLSGVTFTIQTDSDNNVIGILANGDTTISSGDFVALNLPHPNTLTGNYIVNGCPSGGGANTYLQRIGRTASSVYYATEEGSGLALNNVNDIFTISIFVKHASNIVFKPMICLATETDASFAPYSNICPISGLNNVEVKRTGKNQAYDVTYTSTKNQYAPVIKTSYKLKQGKRYVISFYTANTNISIYREAPSVLGFDSLSEYAFDTDGTRKSMYGTATADATISNVDIIKRLSSTSDVESGLCYDLQIEEVSDTVTAPTEYEPYQSETHTTSLPQTTYGGTINVQTGELVVDRIYKTFNGSETWYTSSRWANFYYTVWGNDSKYKPSITGFGNRIQCNKYHGVAKQVDNIQNGEILFNASNISGVYASIAIKDENYASVDDFKASISSTPLQIVYELATPQTYHLTPEQVKLLKGYNHITTNADTLDITYQVDNVLGEILSESEEYTNRVNGSNIANIASTYTPLNKAIVATKGSSKSTADGGNWVAMCNSTATGSPTLPTTGKWWNVISLDNWGTAPINWVSQLALPTPETEHVYYRRNTPGGTSIDSAPWTALLDANNSGLRAQHFGSTISSNNTSINVKCYRFYNGVKMIFFTSDNFQTAKYVTEDGLIPDVLRPTQQNVYGVGYTSQYDSRAFLITTTGRIFIYVSSSVGFNATLVYV